MNLELIALRWLRFEKRCELAFFQRSPRNIYGRNPDVFGVLPSRYTVEVEIKRSVSDFRADSRKRHIANRDYLLDRFPKWFYYLVTPAIAYKVETPDWAGLLTLNPAGAVQVVKKAPANDASKRLSVKECCRLLRVLGNQILSSEERINALRNQHLCGWDYGYDFQI